ncbi:hypothetical protein BBJ28_00003031 [Nothophytophthora sp. Chile5]|nr:hypothetical protein BBJ28_00003031 [Nothophytophthora sp. Chile5]
MQRQRGGSGEGPFLQLWVTRSASKNRAGAFAFAFANYQRPDVGLLQVASWSFGVARQSNRGSDAELQTPSQPPACAASPSPPDSTRRLSARRILSPDPLAAVRWRSISPLAAIIAPLQALKQEEDSRWGARLARLGLLLAHCLFRPFWVEASRTRQSMGTLDQQTSAVRAAATAVLQGLAMDSRGAQEPPPPPSSPTTSSSEPSPQTDDATEDKAPPSPPPSPAAESQVEPLPEQEVVEPDDELEKVKQVQLSKAMDAILARQQEALDHRRHTFSAMSADSRANMRRRSYDLTHFGSTYPPLSPPSKMHHHLQHLRVYGKSCGPTKLASECHEEGDALVAFVWPAPDTVWTRGKPVDIEWTVLDSKVDKLCIELMEDGLSATTLIAREAPNTGFFAYHKVPWGMESGSKYFLRVSSAADPSRFRTSSFFQISSAP